MQHDETSSPTTASTQIRGLDTSRVTEAHAAARAHAARVGLTAQLERQLETLASYGRDPERCRTVLHPDFAPFSFGFTIERRLADGSWRAVIGGGLLYHGPHDGHGSGAHPTLAVTLEPVSGWSVHT